MYNKSQILRAAQGIEGGGIGLTRPEHLSQTDTEYDAYRKRMMMAYRFRPNPLVRHTIITGG